MKLNLDIQEESSEILEYLNKENFIIDYDEYKKVTQVRRIINTYAINNRIPLIYSGFAEYNIMVGPMIIPFESACLCCIEKENLTQENRLNKIEIVPSFISLCLMGASIVATEVTNFFLKFKSSNLIGKTYSFNGCSYEYELFNWKKKSNCELCGGKFESK